jgi:lipopolysaccharide/colanic/teichoic acid biosynthesis glycosyltransferase
VGYEVTSNQLYRRIGKPLLDRTLAAAGLVVLTPVVGALATLVRTKLGSPVFFRQTRPGLHGRPFHMVKFRTITDERDSEGNHLPDAERLPRSGASSAARASASSPNCGTCSAANHDMKRPAGRLAGVFREVRP